MQKRTATKQRPEKGRDVRKDFPLYAHGNGQWAKTIRGNKHYFGPWDDPSSAEAEYLRQQEYLQVGLKPPASATAAAKVLILLAKQNESCKKLHLHQHQHAGEQFAAMTLDERKQELISRVQIRPGRIRWHTMTRFRAPDWLMF
jgi:hypothetical protein